MLGSNRIEVKNQKTLLKLLKPVFWILSKTLVLIPSYGKAIKAIYIEKDIRKLEDQDKYDEARNLRKEFLQKLPERLVGPLWRSEGNDQMYKLNNYEKALEAFEKAICCIEDGTHIAAFQYGITQPTDVYYGAASAAICLSESKKANMYYKKFRDLVSGISNEKEYYDHIEWLKKGIDELRHKKVKNN